MNFNGKLFIVNISMRQTLYMTTHRTGGRFHRNLALQCEKKGGSVGISVNRLTTYVKARKSQYAFCNTYKLTCVLSL